EGIEPKMHRPTSRIEQRYRARVAQALGGFRLLVGLHQQIPAAVTQACARTGPVKPEPADSVVNEELDHIARGDELIAPGELAAVTRRLAGPAHGLTLFFRIEVLIDPADRLVLPPKRLEVRHVELLQPGEQGCLPREQTALRFRA